MPPAGPDRSLTSEPPRPQETSSSERRRTPRTKPAGLTYVKLEPDNGGRLLDVCESGIGFQVVAPVEETGRIQLWFVLDSVSHIEVSGELAWIDDTKRSGGLKFTRPSKQARQQLRAWLSHQRPDVAKDPAGSPAASMPSEDPDRSAATTQPDPLPDYLSHESEFERHLHSLPHTDPAPLESLLDKILTSLQTAHPEDLFARPALAIDETQSQSPAPAIEASSLVEELAQDHASSMPSVAPPAPISTPVRASAAAAAAGASPVRVAAVRRNAPVRSAPVNPTAGPAARELSASSAAPLPAQKSTDVKYVQFRMAVDRVSGMLTTLRHAIAADDSEWPLTALPEFPPVVDSAPAEAPASAAPARSAIAPAAIPVVPPSVAPPFAAPASLKPRIAEVKPAKVIAAKANAAKAKAEKAKAPEVKPPQAQARPIAEPEAQVEMDVRPWSASAPWRATEAPATGPTWHASLATRLTEFAQAVPRSIAPRISQARVAAAAAWIKVSRNIRVASAAFSANTASFLRVAKAGIAPMLSRTGVAIFAATTKAARSAQAASAALLAKARPALRSIGASGAAAATHASRATIAAASAAASATTGQSARAVTQFRKANVLQASREKLATASTGIQRVTSNALRTVIPGDPTLGEIGAMAVVTALLLAGLAAFNYRDKFDASANSFTSVAPSASAPSDSSPEAVATPKKSSGRASKARHASNSAPSAAPAQISTVRVERETMPRPSTREMATALAYLDNKNGQRDPITAAQWLWAASRQGDTSANIVLADLYIRGDGVPQSCAQARVLLLAASKKGNEAATQKLQQVNANACNNATP